MYSGNFKKWGAHVTYRQVQAYRRTGVTVAVRSVAATYDNCIIVPEPSCARPSDIQVIL